MNVNELRAFPFRDREFVRFLKENGVYQETVRCTRETKLSYHVAVLESPSLMGYMVDKNYYLVCLFPWVSATDPDKFATMSIKWNCLADERRNKRQANSLRTNIPHSASNLDHLTT